MAMSSHSRFILAVFTIALTVSGAQSLWCYDCPEGCDYFYFHMARPCAEGKDACIKIEKEGSPTVRGCSNKGVCNVEGLLQEGAGAILNVFTDTGKTDADCCEGILCNGYSNTINILVPVLFLVLILVFFGSCIGCICCCLCRK